MSFYLKYRPQKTSDLDIKIVRDFYQNILKSGKFAHAYLFSGPRGSGKTSSARILAKLLNCEANIKNIETGKSLNEPCGKCNNCQKITNGSSLSVVEMDAASNRGIDDIRALRERIALTPAEGKFIVYIIDEVHMLTTEAFNALLKTLEEPPEHAIFALATTEFHKLPETIVSRCTVVSYPKATPDEVKNSLSKVVKGEDLKISDQALTTLSSSVDGSFRDAMKMLEQLSLAGKEITDDQVNDLANRNSVYDPSKFIDFLIQKDAKSCLDIISSLEQSGIDFAVYTKRILESLRVQLLEAIKNSSSNSQSLINLIEIFSKASLEIKNAFLPQLPIEIAVSTWCLESTSDSSIPTSTPNPNTPTQKPSYSPPPIKPKASNTPTPRPQPAPSPTPTPTPNKNYPTKYLDHNQIVEKWDSILASVKPLNHSLEALLRSSRPVQTQGSTITIEVFYRFHKERLEQEKHRFSIERVISDMFGSKISLNFVLAEKSTKPTTPVKKEPLPQKDSDLAQAAEEIFS